MTALIQYCLLIFLLLLSSCSTHFSNQAKEAIPSSPQSPLLLSLSQAYILDRTIMLKIQIEAKTEVKTATTVVGLIGLKEGVMKEEQYVILSSMVAKDFLSPKERIMVPFSLESGDLTEFQVKLFWGEEGEQTIQSKINLKDVSDLANQDMFLIEDVSSKASLNIPERAPLITNINLLPPEPVKPPMIYNTPEMNDTMREYLRIDEIELHEEELLCESMRCPKKIKMKGILKNVSSNPVSKVHLAFGLFWVPDGKLPLLPEVGAGKKASEEALSFDHKVFEPKEEIEFEVAIGRPVYSIPGGSFMPHVRILDYSIE